jgi:DNA-binding transcriptional ArsR family regulator
VDALSPEFAELIARRFAVLAEPLRIRLLDAMHASGEASVGELAAALGATHANVSKHLQLMLAERMVTRRREGPRAYYRIADPSLIALCEEVCAGVRQSLAELSAIVEVSTTVQEA